MNNFDERQHTRTLTGKTKGRFAPSKQSAYEISSFTPDVMPTDANADRAVVQSSRYPEDSLGADPEFWLNRYTVEKLNRDTVEDLVSAGPDRDLSISERRGWDSVNNLVGMVNVQPLPWCRFKFDQSLRLAENTAAVYRIAGWTGSQPDLDAYWDTRAERLRAIVAGIDVVRDQEESFAA
jgi:hypothetical protein